MKRCICPPTRSHRAAPIVDLIRTGGGPVARSWTFLVDGAEVRVMHEWGLGDNWVITDQRYGDYARRYRGLGTLGQVLAEYPFLAPYLD